MGGEDGNSNDADHQGEDEAVEGTLHTWNKEGYRGVLCLALFFSKFHSSVELRATTRFRTTISAEPWRSTTELWSNLLIRSPVGQGLVTARLHSHQPQILSVCRESSLRSFFPPDNHNSSRFSHFWISRGKFSPPTYDLHEDLLPVFTGLETPVQDGAFRKLLELLLQKRFPFQIIRVGLERGFSFVGCLQWEENKG